MTLAELKARHAAGLVTKAEFIRDALALHRTLFDYVDVVRTTDVREIAIRADGVLFTIGDDAIRMLCPPDEARVAPIEVMNFGRYEPAESAVLARLARDATTIVDVGANIGWYAIWFAHRAPAASIHAFEPVPASFDYLSRNVALNRLERRVACIACGLSDAAGEIDFFVAPSASTNASMRDVAAAADVRRVRAPVTTLDRWCDEHGVVPDLIRCDVEGGERAVFEGGRRTLAVHAPIVFTELLRKWAKPYGYHPNDLIALFASEGYRCFAIAADGPRPIDLVTDDTVETNFAFLHRQRHASAIAELAGPGAQPR